MVGSSFDFTLDDASVLDAFDRLREGVANPAPLLTKIGEYGVESTQARFITQTAPDGSPWAPLNPAYADMKGSADQILTAKGNLRRSMNFRPGLNAVSWGSPMIYAAAHQWGVVIKPKNADALAFTLGGGRGLLPVHLVRVKSVTIPARPYLGISPDDAEAISGLAGTYIRTLL